MTRRFRQLLPLLSSLFLLACSNTAQVDKNLTSPALPDNWQQSKQALVVEDNWLSQLDNPQVQQLVTKALATNHQFAMQAYSLEIAEQQLIVSGSQLWPELDLSFRSGRNKDNQTNSYANSNSVNLNLSYEVDIWGKLSAADQVSNYNYLAQKATFEQYKQQLVVNVVTTWFKVIEADKLLNLYQRRVANSQQNLDIIESGYNSGLTPALDVYLTRNDLNNELTRVSEQATIKTKLIRQLERLIGEYPKGQLLVNANLPLLTNDIPLGLPSELISRKPELKASWYQLLSQDAGLAYAHKQRFPSIVLSGSVGDSAADIGDLLSGSSLAWSLLGSVSAPIFNAGRLKANEEKSRIELKQGEQLYLDTLYNAFNDVENAITTEKSLKHSYYTMLAAQENAQIASALSFEQYQSGLVSYTTVLDAQNRSFEAQTTLIKIKNQLIVNRINLHLFLGGDFTTPSLAPAPTLKAE
ncbi:TolC family protein [Colwellia psychrerythraea]|uniref:RND efflux system, outer membrane lipoprotein, NodT family n=1 Tax=Colwellia psychrerythraea TaxID=28229 RepID=A0A099KLP1_COLPS|nr:TolC family protein [Colwellia psychrerythraea]KGJ91669.1 RND efflux system, outer membrane lipoprotein, NodT family [Colwellia psychrerythraea]